MQPAELGIELLRLNMHLLQSSIHLNTRRLQRVHFLQQLQLFLGAGCAHPILQTRNAPSIARDNQSHNLLGNPELLFRAHLGEGLFMAQLANLLLRRSRSTGSSSRRSARPAGRYSRPSRTRPSNAGTTATTSHASATAPARHTTTAAHSARKHTALGRRIKIKRQTQNNQSIHHWFESRAHSLPYCVLPIWNRHTNRRQSPQRLEASEKFSENRVREKVSRHIVFPQISVHRLRHLQQTGQHPLLILRQRVMNQEARRIRPWHRHLLHRGEQTSEILPIRHRHICRIRRILQRLLPRAHSRARIRTPRPLVVRRVRRSSRNRMVNAHHRITVHTRNLRNGEKHALTRYARAHRQNNAHPPIHRGTLLQLIGKIVTRQLLAQHILMQRHRLARILRGEQSTHRLVSSLQTQIARVKVIGGNHHITLRQQLRVKLIGAQRRLLPGCITVEGKVDSRRRRDRPFMRILTHSC